ncbi:MAG TPA: hypothetical protein PKY87_07630 [Terricaulis sp.]|nr:hypothetical protein [Terricaulis sp.]
MREDEPFGTERAANLWLTFWINALLSALGLYLVLNFALSSGMALLIAIPAGAVIGGMLCRARAVRRWIAHVIQIAAFPWW